MKTIQYESIGIIRTQYATLTGMPIQAALAKGNLLSVAIIDAALTEGLKDLEGFSHVILIYHFHKSSKALLLQKPFLDDQMHGIFSIRSPHRPNPIGISVVSLVKIEENRIYFNHADMLDETPLLDIKPFIPAFDNREHTKTGWLGDFELDSL